MSNQIRNWWRKFGKKQQPAWPRMEQSKYRSYQAQHPFDAEHGVETGGLIYELHSEWAEGLGRAPLHTHWQDLGATYTRVVDRYFDQTTVERT